MKSRLGTIIITGLFCSVLTLIGSQYFLPSKEVVVREKSTANTRFDINTLKLFQRNTTAFSPTDFTLASRKALNAVVSVVSLQDGDDFWSKYHPAQSYGSGVIISNDGYIVTNNHVIQGSSKIKIVLEDLREYEASLIGNDHLSDLALLKIDVDNLPFLLFANSDSLMAGEWVLAVGNPFQLNSTVTVGIVSAKARNINVLNKDFSIESFIQTDAVVNPGNSGGALVNINGELVGINTAIVTESGKFEGYSFAIPSNLVSKVMEDIRSYGQVQRGLLGVTIKNLNWEQAQKFGFERVKGVLVERVNAKGSSDLAGVKKGDVILAIDSFEIFNFAQLQEYVGRYRPGDTINLSIFRAGQIIQLNVLLRNAMNTTDYVNVRNDAELINLGFEIRSLLEHEIKTLKQNGVRVESVYRNSVIDQANMRPGYIITTINDQIVTNPDDVIQTIIKSKKKIRFEGYYPKYKGKYYYEIQKN